MDTGVCKLKGCTTAKGQIHWISSLTCAGASGWSWASGPAPSLFLSLVLERHFGC